LWGSMPGAGMGGMPDTGMGGVPGMASWSEPGESQMLPCALHGKVRTENCLMKDAQGRLICKPGKECKVTSGMGGPAVPDPMLPVQQAAAMALSGEPMCSIHRKVRGRRYLIEDGNGNLICKPGDECKGAGCGAQGEQMLVTCALHGKKRSLDSVTQDATGRYTCLPGKECKGGAGGASNSMIFTNNAALGNTVQQQLNAKQMNTMLLSQLGQGQIVMDNSLLGAGLATPAAIQAAVQPPPGVPLQGFSSSDRKPKKPKKSVSGSRSRSRSRSKKRSRDRDRDRDRRRSRDRDRDRDRDRRR